MNDQKRQYRSSNQQFMRSGGPDKSRAHSKKFDVVHRPITNMTTKEPDGQKAVTTVMCQYNPLHVVSSRELQTHERYDCPDRCWNPGAKISKCTELKL